MTTLGVFASYFRLGVDHILQGIDHLLFVFVLVLLIRDWRRLLGAVTAFTVAHSLSLAAASLGWIIIPISAGRGGDRPFHRLPCRRGAASARDQSQA